MASKPQMVILIIDLIGRLELLSFQNRPSSKIIHSQWGTAGPTADLENVPTWPIADSNTNVLDVPKNMQQLHVGKGLQNSTSLPTPVRVNKLNHFLQGYNSHLKYRLVQGLKFGFKIN